MNKTNSECSLLTYRTHDSYLASIFQGASFGEIFNLNDNCCCTWRNTDLRIVLVSVPTRTLTSWFLWLTLVASEQQQIILSLCSFSVSMRTLGRTKVSLTTANPTFLLSGSTNSICHWCMIKNRFTHFSSSEGQSKSWEGRTMGAAVVGDRAGVLVAKWVWNGIIWQLIIVSQLLISTTSPTWRDWKRASLVTYFWTDIQRRTISTFTKPNHSIDKSSQKLENYGLK